LIPVKHAHLHTGAITHPGLKGKNNEDRYAINAYFIDQLQANSVLALVSDGIGGHRAGEIAADITVQTITQVVAESDASQPQATLQAAIMEASEAIRQQSEMDPSRQGMGATVVCAWVIGDQLYMANVGDSRLYLMREGVIHKLSTDHTWVQEAIDQGLITPEQARKHPNAHVIRRYLGSPQSVVPDFRLHLDEKENDLEAEANQGMRLLPGDLLILCSDGLTDLVSETEIASAFKGRSMNQALDLLVSLANDRGGHDNITIVTLQMPMSGDTISMQKPVVAPVSLPAASVGATQPLKPVSTVEPKPRSPRRRLLFTSCLGVLLIALVAGGAFSLWNFALRKPSPTATPTLIYTATKTVTPFPILGPTLTPAPTSPILFPTISGSPSIPRPTITPWPTNTPPPINLP
jgi:protein phosphatase